MNVTRIHSTTTASLVAVMLLGSAAMAQDMVSFEAGSIIIPEDATYQTGCGSVSGYGLVYEILRQNDTGGVFGPTNPVTIYWVINPNKSSPNRCVPSNKHSAPLTNPNSLAAATRAAMWNDGCDLVIPNDPAVSSASMPVVKVDYATAVPATLLYDPNSAGSAITTLAALPDYPTTMTLNNTGVGAARFNKIRYKGGPFLIGANDAARVITHMKDVAARANTFATTCSTSCTTFSATTASDCHYVTMHMSLVPFQAPVNKRINRVPPRIAVLQSGPGVKGDMLPKYLASAGLNFAGASGCPPNADLFRTCNIGSGQIYDTFDSPTDLKAQTGFPQGLLNQIDPTTGRPYYRVLWMPHWDISESTCASSDSCSEIGERAKSTCDSNRGGARACGDNVCEDDSTNVRNIVRTACNAGSSWASISGPILTLLQSSRSRCRSAADSAAALARIQAQYAVAPAGGCSTGAVNADRASALRNIKYFADQTGNGIFAECAAIGSLEADYESGTRQRYLYNDATAAQVNSLNPGAGPFANPQFMFSNQAQINGVGGSWSGQNCSDPDFSSSGGSCMVYPNAGSPFSQIADFNFVLDTGLVESFGPKSGTTPLSSMRSGVTRLAVSWTNFSQLVPGTISSPTVPASYSPTISPSTRNWDIFTVMQKDNDPNKATIIYLGGHDYPDSVSGTRIALNTLLNLGANPVSSDRSITAPVAFDDTANGNGPLLLTSTFKAMSGTLLPNTETFVAANGSRFQFPFVRGDLRAHLIVGAGALAAGENALDDSVAWSAQARLWAPGARNIFTYTGGTVTVNPTLPGGAVAPRGIMQVGWAPLAVKVTEIAAPTAGAKHTQCADELAYGEVIEAGASFLGLKKNAAGDGVCDLQQLFSYSGLDPDASWNLTAVDRAQLTTDVNVVKQLTSMVRGYCYATVGKVDGAGAPVLAPNLADCNGASQNNVAEMGGLVNSTAAVVQSTVRIPGAGGIARPTVAYVGGHDGQLHAIYVSGGAGYTGPSATLNYPANNASSTFATNLAPFFANVGSLPPAGTELWSFMPSTQFPFLKSNGARVDSSPAVQDVFVDLTGNGIREWHTILAVSVGESSRQIFAMDVSDPLKPVLLWDLVGSSYKPSGYPEIASTTGFANTSVGSAYSFRWNGTYRSAAIDNTSYQLPPLSDPGRTSTGLYNYVALGSARSLSIGQVRAGLEPVYSVFVGSSSSGVGGTASSGLQVFSIDIATGQKLWQWEREFIDATRVSQNAVPRGVTLTYGDEGTRRLFVGDFEGRLWELDAVTGINVNYQPSTTGCTGNCNIPAFDTLGTLAAPQPITSNIGIAKMPPLPTGDFGSYANENVMMFGTGGSSLVPVTVGGEIHALLANTSRRKPVVTGGTHLDGSPWTAASALSDAKLSGMLQAPANWPKYLAAPERIYGTLTIAGQTAIIPTANGSVNLGDIAHSAPASNLTGRTYTVDFGSITGTPSSVTSFSLANFGGVAVFHQSTGSGSQDFLLTTEVSKIAVSTVTNASATGPVSPNTALNPNVTNGITYRLLNWFKSFLND